MTARARKGLARIPATGIRWALPCIAVLAGRPAAADPAGAIPEGTGKAEVARACAQCHSLETVARSRLTRTQWEAKIDQMIVRGAKVTDEEIDVIATYLAAHFGPGGGG